MFENVAWNLVRACALAFVLCVAAAPRTASASPVRAKIDTADRLINQSLRYGPAIELLERALADTRITQPERVDGYRLLGVAHIARGQNESGQAAFLALLRIDPSYVLDERMSPKIREVFDRARQTMRPRIRDVTAIVTGRRVVVSGRVDDPADVMTDVDLYARVAGEHYERTAMELSEGGIEGTIDLPELLRLSIDYYVVGRTHADPIVNVGDENAPLSLIVQRAPTAVSLPPVVAAPEASTPWYGTWWFWTIAGVAVAGAVVTTVVVTSDGSDAPAGTLGPIRLP